MFYQDSPRLIGICKDKALVGPRRLEIEINTTCNLHCIFCWFHAPDTPTTMEPWELPLPLFKELMDDARALGVQHVYITGRGEPGLHPDLPAMLRYAKQKGFFITLTTNLTVISRELLAALMLTDKIEITCCGFPAKKYTQIHRPADAGIFTRLEKNLLRLAKLSRARGRPQTKINYILTRKNIASARQMIDLCRTLGINAIRLSPLSHTEQTRALIPTRVQLNSLKRRLGQLHLKDLDLDMDWLNLGKVDVKQCYMGWFTALVGVGGRVKVGCFDSPLPDDGNIYKTRFNKIWTSARTNKHRRLLKDALGQLDFCGACGRSARESHAACPFAGDNIRIEQALAKQKPAP